MDGVTNLAGVRGVAVVCRDDVRRYELLPDPRSHRVIGKRDVVVGNQKGLQPGTVLFESAVLESALVDEVRERPDGTLREGPIEGNEEPPPKKH